jgi:hypothetical protein
MYCYITGVTLQILKLCVFWEDLRQRLGAVIVVGTTLHVPLLERFTAKLCQKIKSRNKKGIVMWLSNEPPKLSKGLKSIIDFEFIEDCDYFASQGLAVHSTSIVSSNISIIVLSYIAINI